MTKLSALLLLALALAGCASDAGNSTSRPNAVRAMERAHGLNAWRNQRALETELLIVPQSGPPLRTLLTFTTDGVCSRMDMDDNAGVTFDGAHAWVWPAGNGLPVPRYYVRHWSYVSALPFKLRDPGTIITDLGALPYEGRELPAVRLSFAPGTGDAPRDWYILYSDPDTGRLAAVAYISTYGKEPATPGPAQCVVFDRYKTIDAVTLPTGWTFYNWSQDKGPFGRPIANAIMDGLKFVDPPDHFFDKPVLAHEDRAP